MKSFKEYLKVIQEQEDKGISNLEWEDLSDDLQAIADEVASDGWDMEDVLDAIKELMLDGMPEDDIEESDVRKALEKDPTNESVELYRKKKFAEMQKNQKLKMMTKDQIEKYFKKKYGSDISGSSYTKESKKIGTKDSANEQDFFLLDKYFKS